MTASDGSDRRHGVAFRWVLVDGQLLPGACDVVCLHYRDARGSGSAHGEEPVLPVMPGGRVHGLVRIPEGTQVIGLRDALGRLAHPVAFSYRDVGWFERQWRMLWRVWNTGRRYGAADRRRLGFTAWRAVTDLAGAYRAVSGTRFSLDYAAWIRRYGRIHPADLATIERALRANDRLPTIQVLVFAPGRMANSGRALDATMESLRAQLYKGFECVVLDGAPDAGGAFDDRVGHNESGFRIEHVGAAMVHRWLDQADRRGDERKWTWVLKAGDRLAPEALYVMAAEAGRHADALAFYADHDVIDEHGERSAPCFKPDWSPEHFLARDFPERALLLKNAAIAEAGGLRLENLAFGPGELLLRMMALHSGRRALSVRHLPFVLVHQSAASPCLGDATAWWQRAVVRHLAEVGVAAEVGPGVAPGCVRVSYPLPSPVPRVSVVVPTRDRRDLLARCIESLTALTAYPDLEILVIDNQSSAPDALDYLSSLDGRRFERGLVRVLRYPQPFNYSAINNFAVRQASGSVLCLLNNDTEIRDPGWLTEMVGQLAQDRVGIVGAKLLFPDGTVQHAGDTVGPGGCADHMFSGLPGDAPGYCNLAAVTRQVSAVTAACLVTWKDLYLSLGGLDEQKLKVAFNDVDYCLRVREAGFKVVFTPHAVVIHHESATRGQDRSPEAKRRTRREADHMRRRWKAVMQVDPFYNPNLNYARPDFTLGAIPRVAKPWESRP